MESSGKIAIATFVIRSKQYLAAIRPQEQVLVLETMFFAEEVRDSAQEIDKLPAGTDVKTRDIDMAVQLIESMATEWHPENYRDTYRERVEALLDAKREGHDVVTDQPTETSSNVVDLMEALRASIDAAKGHRPGNAAQAGTLRTRPRAAGEDGDRLADMTKKQLYQLGARPRRRRPFQHGPR